MFYIRTKFSSSMFPLFQLVELFQASRKPKPAPAPHPLMNQRLKDW
jgi:hypothetical protein